MYIKPCVNLENISTESLAKAVFPLLFVLFALFVSYVLNGAMRNNHLKTVTGLNLGISGIFALLLYLRFGLTLTAIQGLVLFFVLLYASHTDINYHRADDFIWVMILILGLVSIRETGIFSALAGAAVIFLPQILLAMLYPKNSFGGADIKISTSLAFLLGLGRGIAAYLLGLLISVAVVTLYRKIKRQKTETPFALVPFLSAGAVIMFFI